MKCARFEELIFERVEGTLDAETVVMLDAHAAGCERCADLAAMLTSEVANPTDDFTASVLALTSERAPLDRALRQLDIDLPSLASIAPDDDFVADVMAVTVEADRKRLHRRLAAFWDSLVQRPRFALEGAYVGAVAGFLLVGLPGSPLAGVPEQVLSELRAQQASVSTTLAAGSARFNELSAATWERAGTLTTLPQNDRVDDLPSLRSRTSSLAEATRDAAAMAWNDYVVAGANWLMSPWISPNESEPNEQNQREDDDNRSSHSA